MTGIECAVMGRYRRISRWIMIAATVATGLGPARAQAVRVRGITEPVRDAVLSAEVAGRLAEIPVEEGDRVETGDALIQLDRRLEELEVERRRLVWESKVEVESASDRVETVRQDLEGTRHLYETTRSVSDDELHLKELEHLLAVAEWERLKLAELREEIEFRMAEEQLERRVIRAPWAGVVARLTLEVGESCEPRQPLARVVDATRCRFVTNVDASAATALKVGRSVRLSIDGGDGSVEREGTISFISPVVDPASGLREVKAVFDNDDGLVQPGVAGWMEIDEKRDAAD